MNTCPYATHFRRRGWTRARTTPPPSRPDRPQHLHRQARPLPVAGNRAVDVRPGPEAPSATGTTTVIVAVSFDSFDSGTTLPRIDRHGDHHGLPPRFYQT